MDMLHLIVEGFGWLCIAAFVLAIGVCLREDFDIWRSRRAYRQREAQRLEARRELGNLIASESHWFSESKPTAEALFLIGHALAEHGGYNVDKVRQEWRETTTTQEPTQ